MNARFLPQNIDAYYGLKYGGNQRLDMVIQDASNETSLMISQKDYRMI